MKIKIEINNKTKKNISKKFFVEIVKKTLKKSDCSFLDKKTVIVTFAIVSNREITLINEKYRKKEGPTDVLSFPEFRTKNEIKKQTDDEIFIGEILLCYNYIEKTAFYYKENFESSLAENIAHGILHLLGFNHGRHMFSIQKKVIS